MTLQSQQSLALMTFLLLLLIQIEGNSTPNVVYENDTTVSSSPNSPKLMNKDENQETFNCTYRPWVCSRGEFPPRSLCCANRCVDVTRDRDNCGLCGIRCRYTSQCCNRFCINTSVSPFNCGRCGRICPIGRLCIFGLCSLQQTVSPSPSFPPVPPPQKPPQPQPQPPQPQPHPHPQPPQPPVSSPTAE